MKRILFVLLLGIVGTAAAQDTFTFNFLEERLDESEVNPIDVKSNFFGEDVARKLALLADGYTWLQEATPTNPVPQRITEKYWIYTSIKKLNNYYKKAAKKNVMSKEAAESELVKAIDIGLCVRYQDTSALEELLETTRGDEKVAGIFANQIILSGSMEYGQALTEANDE